MKSLIADRVRRHQDQIKANAQESKKSFADSKNALKNAQPKQEELVKVQLAKESKTLMLDV